VKRAGRFPVTHAEMMRSLQNEEWVNSLLAMSPALELVIETGDEAPSELYSGTPCQAVITVDSRRPIALLLPDLACCGGQ
jgi:hypothetical protein